MTTNIDIELVQLENGDVVLRNPQAPETPLLKFSFSADLERILNDVKLDISKVMVEAGMGYFQQLQAVQFEGRAQSQFLH